MAQSAESKMHVVVLFLAVLELYKQGYIDIELSEKLGDMNIALIGDREKEINVNADDWGEDLSSANASDLKEE